MEVKDNKFDRLYQTCIFGLVGLYRTKFNRSLLNIYVWFGRLYRSNLIDMFNNDLPNLIDMFMYSLIEPTVFFFIQPKTIFFIKHMVDLVLDM